MKWTTKKYDKFSNSYSCTGRKKKCKCTVNYNSVHKNYYFLIEYDGKTFNSLWENLSFSTEEECKNACEEYVNTITAAR